MKGIRRRGARGFTLVELMVAIAVFAILTAIAYPMYQDHIRKGRRAAVKGSLLQLSQFMERNYTETMRYDQDAGGNSIDINYILDSPLFASAREKIEQHYTVSFVGNGNSYTLQAIPKSGQTDDKCGTMALLSNGNRTADHAGCW